jgi:hypothetical protein
VIKRSTPLLLVMLAGLLCAQQAQATLRRPALSALSTGESTDGTLSELWFTVFDPVGEASYTLDLGVTMAMLRSTNVDAGSAADLAPAGSNIAASFVAASDTTNDYAFWIVDATVDTAWSQFAAATTLSNAVWAVMGSDAVGSSAAGNRRMLLTIGQGNEGSYRSLTNNGLNGLFSPVNEFVGLGVNNRPSHSVDSDVTGDLESSIAINGSSYDTKAANPDAYFGKVADAFSALNVPAVTNPIGQSAWFYDISRSGANQLLQVNIDEFDNLAGDAYWGFIAEAGDTGRYLLSYTTPRFVSQAETAAALTFENSFARLAGVLSVASAVGQSDAVISLTDGFLRRLVSRSATRAQVDSGVLQMAQGLAGLGLWSRRRAG